MSVLHFSCRGLYLDTACNGQVCVLLVVQNKLLTDSHSVVYIKYGILGIDGWSYNGLLFVDF